jgi:cation diffusion facilitator family transporter
MIRDQNMGLTGLVVRWILSDQEDPTSLEGRSRLGEFEGLVALLLSLILGITKAILAWITSSISLLADSVNNFADVGSSIIVMLGFRLARKPRDRQHPYGHGRLETVATLVLATILVGVAFEVGRAGIERLLNPVDIHASGWILVAIIATIVLKAGMALFAHRLARITLSSMLKADAWNHTFDIVSTALVMLALVSSQFGLSMVDGWAGIGVSVLIAYTGYRYILEAVHSLIGAAPPHKDLHLIQKVARSVPGVYGVHDIIVHDYGDRRLISLHAEVNADQSALEVHDLAERVEETVSEALIAKVTVHADPVDHSHPLHRPASEAVLDIVESQGDVVGFHDLRVEGDQDNFDLSVDLVLCSEVDQGDFSPVSDRLARRIRSRLPGLNTLTVGIEIEYASDQEFRKAYGRMDP